jgi:putative redox protein
VKEKFKIKNRKSLEIVGILSIPENPKGLAFTLHGLGAFKEHSNTLVMAETFFSESYTVVNFDTTNSIGESEGKYEDATAQNHYEDLVDVITWAKKQTWYQEPFLLSGESLGGYASIRYAEESPLEVKGVFTLAPFIAGELSLKNKEISHPEHIKAWKETGWFEEKGTSKPGVIKRLPWSHMEEKLKHDIRPDASKLIMPVCLVVGENDHPETQKILYELIPNKKELNIIADASHVLRTPEHLDELKNILKKWLEKMK